MGVFLCFFCRLAHRISRCLESFVGNVLGFAHIVVWHPTPAVVTHRKMSPFPSLLGRSSRAGFKLRVLLESFQLRVVGLDSSRASCSISQLSIARSRSA